MKKLLTALCACIAMLAISSCGSSKSSSTKNDNLKTESEDETSGTNSCLENNSSTATTCEDGQSEADELGIGEAGSDDFFNDGTRGSGSMGGNFNQDGNFQGGNFNQGGNFQNGNFNQGGNFQNGNFNQGGNFNGGSGYANSGGPGCDCNYQQPVLYVDQYGQQVVRCIENQVYQGYTVQNRAYTRIVSGKRGTKKSFHSQWHFDFTGGSNYGNGGGYGGGNSCYDQMPVTCNPRRGNSCGSPNVYCEPQPGSRFGFCVNI